MEDFIARNQKKLYEAWSAIAMSQEIKYESVFCNSFLIYLQGESVKKKQSNWADTNLFFTLICEMILFKIPLNVVNSNSFVILFKCNCLDKSLTYEANYLLLYSFNIITPYILYIQGWEKVG